MRSTSRTIRISSLNIQVKGFRSSSGWPRLSRRGHPFSAAAITKRWLTGRKTAKWVSQCQRKSHPVLTLSRKLPRRRTVVWPKHTRLSWACRHCSKPISIFQQYKHSFRIPEFTLDFGPILDCRSQFSSSITGTFRFLAFCDLPLLNFVWFGLNTVQQYFVSFYNWTGRAPKSWLVLPVEAWWKLITFLVHPNIRDAL